MRSPRLEIELVVKDIIKKYKKALKQWIWRLRIMCGKAVEACTEKDVEIAFFDPSLDTYNLGDEIISYYCRQALNEFYDCDHTLVVQTHRIADKETRHRLIRVKKKIVFGTNLISPNVERYSIWAFPKSLLGYRGTIAMGVGAGHHCEDASEMSQLVYGNIFSKEGIHSVRDSNTEFLFHQMGIHNVLNTGCPTLWNLTPEHCQLIPTAKAKSVVATITDYDRDPVNDAAMLNILREEYSQVYVWIQGADDLAYLQTLINVNSVKIVEHSLAAYTAILENEEVDYVGTRLHAGIHALNYRIRSLVISIDNRAAEMGRDFALPVIPRESAAVCLRDWIYGRQETKLNLPWERIALWKAQFHKNT